MPDDQTPDQQTAPAGYDQGQQLLAGGGLVQGNVVREYIWGPGDNGFDELLVQYDQNGAEAWAIQDAGGDLVALCDLHGDNGIDIGFAQVVGQWTYDAYGEVLTAEHLGPFAQPRLGHKGLFLARLDGTPSSPRVIPFAHTVYHMRNRTYAPGLGRFLQRDPNQTAMALVEATAMHGRGLGALSLAFDIEGLYGDGGNLYEYLGSNPWVRSDVLGLYSEDPFDMVDEHLAERAANASDLYHQLGQGTRATSIVVAHISTLIPIVNIAGEFALAALGTQSYNEAVVWAAIGLVPGGKLAVIASKQALKFINRFKQASKQATEPISSVEPCSAVHKH